MSRKYIDTSFTSFVKHKLNEVIKSEQVDIEKPAKDEIEIDNVGSDMPDEESELKKNKKEPKFGSQEYMAELHREFNKIVGEYDNLYGH